MRSRSFLVLGWLVPIGRRAPGAAGQVLQQGDIVVSDRGAGTVVRIDPGTSTQTQLASGLSSVRGMLASRLDSIVGSVRHLVEHARLRGWTTVEGGGVEDDR